MSASNTHPFNWNRVYVDPVRHTRTLGTGFHNIPIAAGAWPAGYRVANGQDGGGFPAANQTNNGTLPIRIQPPFSGNGRVMFVTNLKFIATNRGNSVVQMAGSLGVANVSGGDRPMMPYLGVSHDRDPWTDSLLESTVQPGQSVQIVAFRFDIVDQAFAPVPGWPNWRMVPATNNRLWPAVSPTIRVKGGSLVIGGVYVHGYCV